MKTKTRIVMLVATAMLTSGVLKGAEFDVNPKGDVKKTIK